MHDCRVNLAHLHQFSKQQITTVFDGASFITNFHCREMDQVLRDLLANPDIADKMALNAERKYTRHPDGTRNMRVYDEYYHGDDMWEIQVSLSTRCTNDS